VTLSTTTTESHERPGSSHPIVNPQPHVLTAMNLTRPLVSLFLSSFLACALLAAARAEEGTSSVKLSAPAQPARIEIMIARGNLRINGSDTPEVTVKSEVKAASTAPRKDGLRVISASSGYVLAEKDNVVTLDATAESGKTGGADFNLTVPRSAAIIVQNSFGGNITCTGVAGNLELNSLNGTIRLEDVSGGVIASTMNGEIRATLRELREGNALSFTSMNGEVSLRLPAEAKANVRLRTQNGAVLTDFDESRLITKTENTPGFPRTRHVIISKSGSSSMMSDDVHEAIREAAQVSATAVREAMNAVKQGLEAAREESNRARARAHAEDPDAPAAPAAPKPPKAPSPTITGGKLVTGTLNGGGPEISVSTMNGDVTLRKIEAAK